jgi:hypothetical protein
MVIFKDFFKNLFGFDWMILLNGRICKKKSQNLHKSANFSPKKIWYLCTLIEKKNSFFLSANFIFQSKFLQTFTLERWKKEYFLFFYKEKSSYF